MAPKVQSTRRACPLPHLVVAAAVIDPRRLQYDIPVIHVDGALYAKHRIENPDAFAATLRAAAFVPYDQDS